MSAPNHSDLSHDLGQLSIQEGPRSPEELYVSTLDGNDSWTQEMYEQKLSNLSNSIDPYDQRIAPNYEDFCSCIGSVSLISPRDHRLMWWKLYMDVLSKHTVQFFVDFKFKRIVERNDFHRSMRNLSTWFRNESKEYCNEDLDGDYWHLFLQAIQSFGVLCVADAYELGKYPDDLTDTEQTATVIQLVDPEEIPQVASIVADTTVPLVYPEEIPQIASIVADTSTPPRDYHHGTEATDTVALSGEYNHPIISTTRQQRRRRPQFETIAYIRCPRHWPSITIIQPFLRPCCQDPGNEYITRDNDRGSINGRRYMKYRCGCFPFAPNESDGAWIRILRQTEDPEMYDIQINKHNDNKCHHWNSDGTIGNKVELLQQNQGES